VCLQFLEQLLDRVRLGFECLLVVTIVGMMKFVQQLSHLSLKEVHEQLVFGVAQYYRVHDQFPSGSE
jgi:hypothetical protein